MKYFRIAFIFGLALMFLAGCSKEEIQPDPQNALDEAALKSGKAVKSDGCIPLHGTFHVYIDEELGNTNLPPKILRVLGEGNLIHLGKTDVRLIQAWIPIPGTGLPPTPPWKGQGWSTCSPDGTECHIKFTTEDGSELHAKYGTPPSMPPPLPVYIPGNAISYHKTYNHVEVSLTGSVITDQCTGIFEGASGVFSWNVIFNPNQEKGVAKIRGQIDLPQD